MNNSYKDRMTTTALTILASVLGLAPRSMAADFLIPGIQGKAAAGAGQTVSRGASSLYYNPANLSTARGVQPEIDLALARITYSYQHSDTSSYVPATVSAITPLATVGLAWNPVAQLGLGLALLPTGAGTAQVDKGVPAQLSPGSYEPMDITRIQTSFRAAAGASWSFNNMLAVGAGLLYYSDTSKLTLIRSGTTTDFLVADFKGTSKQFCAGARLTLKDDYVVGVSYRTAATRPYVGTLAVNTASSNATEGIYQITDFTGVGYDPAQFGLGLEGRRGRFGAFFDYVREQWSGGRSILKQGLGGDSPNIDLIDTNNITVGARFWPTAKQRLEVALGIDGGNMGNGDPVTKGTVLPEVGGVRVGQIEAVGRTIFAGGYRYGLSRSTYLALAGAYMTGSHTVPPGYTQEGTFTLNVLLMSAGTAYIF